MASTTKMMTALVAVTNGQLDQSITVGSDVQSLAGTGASVAGLIPGERLTLRELLYALLLPSGDDAAITIADGVAGSQANFVALMNQRAQQLGLANTHYVNVHGLDAAGQYSSAADLASLAIVALRNPVIATIVATPATTLPATAGHPALPLTNSNELLNTNLGAGISILGVKTGATGNAGYCLVFAASGPNGELMGAVLHDTTDDPEQRFTDARTLLTWGFALEARLRMLSRPGGLHSGGD
jgi:D-alanyl-D-alanine carboxypeptidase (penicillin-binding protein 5/6)